jgi:hypothetical protein
MFSFVALATLKEASFSNTAVKCMALWSLTNGILMVTSPTTFGKFYGIPERDDFVYFHRRYYGWNLASLNVFITALAFGGDHFKALGAAWGVGFLSVASFAWITKEYEKFGVSMIPVYAWMVIMVIFTGVLSI